MMHISQPPSFCRERIAAAFRALNRSFQGADNVVEYGDLIYQFFGLCFEQRFFFSHLAENCSQFLGNLPVFKNLLAQFPQAERGEVFGGGNHQKCEESPEHTFSTCGFSLEGIRWLNDRQEGPVGFAQVEGGSYFLCGDGYSPNLNEGIIEVKTTIYW